MSSSVPAEPALSSAAAVAGAAGAAAEVPPGPVAAHASAIAATLCANCGAPLAGRYCSQCGQRHHEQPIHHLGHFIREATEDLTHADSRLWQTLIALLFRPGFLTREFLEDRRARYLPPVRLYLVVSVIFFVIAGLESRASNSIVVVSYSGKSVNYKVVPAPGAAPAAGGHTKAPAASGADDGLAAIAATPAAQQHVCAQSATFFEQHAGWLAGLGPRLERSCLAGFAQGGVERLNQIVEHNLERAMFLFLPLLALVMKPLYRKPPRHYVEHLLFFLHNHAFLFVMLGCATVLKMITSSRMVLGPIELAITIYVPVYFYRAMRRVYGQGRWLTLGKLSTLGVAYFFLGVVMFVATFSYSFLML